MAVVITSVSPTILYPGREITIVGTGFGATQGDGDVYLDDNAGVQAGGYIDLFTIDSWSDTEITATFGTPGPGGDIDGAEIVNTAIIVGNDSLEFGASDRLLILRDSTTPPYFHDEVFVSVQFSFIAESPFVQSPNLFTDDRFFEWKAHTDRVRGFSFGRGRNHELDTIDTGVCSISLDNSDGEFNPINTQSSLYPNVKPMVPVRMVAAYIPGGDFDSDDWEYFHLFTGFVESWPLSFPEKVDAVVNVEGSDLLKVLNLAKLQGVSYEDLVVSKEPVAFWRFQDAAGLADSSGHANNHDLSWSGTPDPDNAGVWTNDKSIALDGTNDFAIVANEADLELRQAMSIEMWVRPHAVSSEDCILSCRTTGDPLYEIIYDANNEGFKFTPTGAAGSTTFIGGLGNGPNEWYHIVVSINWDGSNRIITGYLNGELRVGPTTYAYQPGVATRAVHVGRLTSTNYFDGDISELVIYDRVLTAAEVLTHYNTKRESFEVQRTDERIADIMDLVGFDATDLEVGQSEMQATDPSESVMDEITKASDTEFGNFFVAANGKVRFHDRHYRVLSQATPIAEFAVDEIPYQDIVPSYDDSNIYNIVTITPGDDAEPVIATDEDSVEDYGPRNLDRTTYPNNANEAIDAAYGLLALYADPAMRVGRIVFDLGNNSAQWPIVLGAEFGNRYTVTKALAGDDLSIDVYLESISMEVSRDKTWRVTWELSPALTQSMWVLGDETLGVLGSTTFLGW